MLVVRVRDQARARLEVRVGRNGRILQVERVGTLFLDQTGSGALRQRGTDKATTIGGRARPGDEAAAHAHLAAVGLQLAGHARAQPTAASWGVSRTGRAMSERLLHLFGHDGRLDRHVRLHAHNAQRLLHDFAETGAATVPP